MPRHHSANRPDGHPVVGHQPEHDSNRTGIPRDHRGSDQSQYVVCLSDSLSFSGARAKEKEDKKKEKEREEKEEAEKNEFPEPPTIQQEDNMTISGLNQRMLLMQKLTRQDETKVCEP